MDWFVLGDVKPEVIQYCERFLELMIDLEALLPTRRFFNTVMDDCHLVVRCHLAALRSREDGNLFSQVCSSHFIFCMFLATVNILSSFQAKFSSSYLTIFCVICCQHRAVFVYQTFRIHNAFNMCRGIYVACIPGGIEHWGYSVRILRTLL